MSGQNFDGDLVLRDISAAMPELAISVAAALFR